MMAYEPDKCDPDTKAAIDKLSHWHMAHKWRFAPTGDPMLQGAEGAYFQQRFKELGGMTPALSKELGW